MTIPSQSIGPINSLRNYSTDGLILNVDFNNDYGFSGNTAEDLANNVVYSTPGGFISVVSGSTATPGYIDLDGTTDYLIAGSTTSNFYTLQNFTVDAWVYRDVNSYLQLLANRGSTAHPNNRGFNLYLTDFSNPGAGFNSGQASTTSSLETTLYSNPPINEWVNVFWRVEASPTGLTLTGKFFRPGDSSADYIGVGNTFSQLGITSNNFVHIGTRMNPTGQRFNGKISSVRVYNRVLSPEEIEFNYARNKTRYGHT